MTPRFLLPMVLLILLAAASVFQLSFAVVWLEDELSAVNEELRNEALQLRTLRADWAFLSRPERLERQAMQVDMVPTTPLRIVRIEQLGRMRELELAREPLIAELPSGRQFEIRVKPLVPFDLTTVGDES